MPHDVRNCRKKVDQLTAENTELLADREEKERLEKQLELSAQYDYDKVGARVIARDSDNWFNVLPSIKEAMTASR